MIHRTHLLHIYYCTNSPWSVWPNYGMWELIDSHGAGTFVCPLNTGRGIGTEIGGWGNVLPPDDLFFGSDNNTNYMAIYKMYLTV